MRHRLVQDARDAAVHLRPGKSNAVGWETTCGIAREAEGLLEAIARLPNGDLLLERKAKP